MKQELQLKKWLENKEVFPKSENPEGESHFRLYYNYYEGKPMKWGAAMEDAVPEEPAEVEIQKIEIQLQRDMWINITNFIDPIVFENLTDRILEGEFE